MNTWKRTWKYHSCIQLWASGECCKPKCIQCKALVGIRGNTPTKIFLCMPTKQKDNVYIKYVFLDICIKGQFESNKCLPFIKSKTPFSKKIFFFTFLRKNSKKIFSKPVTIIAYKVFLMLFLVEP